MNNTLKATLLAIEEERYSDAARLLKPLADKGEPEAMAHLGFLYQVGFGVDRDVNKAVDLLTKAAELGIGVAAHNLGTLYLTGYPDIELDHEKSQQWFQRARELGFLHSAGHFKPDQE
ncbi:MAG: tetratricopeptide repeat protein [Anaerolineales bacterium]|nr:tetratricopeptide repeat protein [Anaerolineales bacterium]